jgi:hypothetical protein
VGGWVGGGGGGDDQWFCLKTLKCCGYDSTNVVIGIYPLTHLFDPHLDLRSMKSVSWHGSCAVGSFQFKVLFFEHHCHGHVPFDTFIRS